MSRRFGARAELESSRGVSGTGGGELGPISDVDRMLAAYVLLALSRIRS